jgi:hypothetical protein
MSRITGSDAKGLMEAYQAVYAPQELTEEQIWEEVENWVNSLLEEGYDLSEYTWDEMYEAYITEVVPLAIPAAMAAAPYVLPALGAAAYTAKELMNRRKTKNTPEQERFLNTGSFAASKESERRGKEAAELNRKQNQPTQPTSTPVSGPTSTPVSGRNIRGERPKIRVTATRPQGSTTSTPGASAQQPKPKPEAPKPEPTAKDLGGEITRQSTTPGQSSTSSTGASGGGKPPAGPEKPTIDPLKTVKDLAKKAPEALNQTLGKPARERAFGTTRAGQLTRGATVAGVSALDIGGKVADPSKPSALSAVGSVGPGAVGTVLQGAGNIPGIKGTSLGTGARGTGTTLRQVGREMRDQTKPKKLFPEGLSLENIISEGPDWKSAPKPKGIAALTLGKETKVYIPGLGWQFPKTARNWARSQGYTDWNKIPNPSQPPKPPAAKPKDGRLDSPVAGTGPKGAVPVIPAPAATSTAPTKPSPPKSAIERSAQGYAVGTTKGGTKYEIRTPTRAEMDASRKAGGGEAGVKAAVSAGQPTTGPAPTQAQMSDAGAAAKAAAAASKVKKESYDAYDLVLEYILSQGHAETIAEAHYVMMEMDAEMIGDIVESYIR